MPNRFFTLAILVAWTFSTVALLRRDVLPGLLVGAPPDLRSLLRDKPPVEGPSHWSILVASEEDSLNLHPVGRLVTEVVRSRDGWVNLTSRADIDSKELLRATPFASSQGERVVIRSVFAIEPSGNLETFRIGVELGGLGPEILILDGKVIGDHLNVSAHGVVPLLNWKRRFPYHPHSLVQSSMSPLEFMPGLNVGQRWSTRIVSPLTGAIEEVSVEVERRRIITWDENPVTTHEVVTRSGSMTLRSWVRPDGMVLRQEIPFPFVKLVVERLPERLNSENAAEGLPL